MKWIIITHKDLYHLLGRSLLPMRHVVIPFDDLHLDFANYDQFAPNFDMVCKTIQHVSVPIIKTELWRKKLDNFLLCNMGKWVGGHSFPLHHGCHDIYVLHL